jgi:hypothetical protein
MFCDDLVAIDRAMPLIDHARMVALLSDLILRSGPRDRVSKDGQFMVRNAQLRCDPHHEEQVIPE